MRTLIPAVIVAVLLSACGKPPPDPAAAAPPRAPIAAASAASLVDGWLGRWPGPEGTYLDIEGAAGAYRVTVRNLDGPRRFDATAADGGLSFTRDGTVETLRPGSGADTGMKWLADKKDCLVVKPGEGYCRS